MSVEIKNDNHESSPESDNLKLNLTFASVDDLVEELKKRGDAVVVLYLYSNRQGEEADSIDEPPDRQWSVGYYKGPTATCVGLCESYKNFLLKTFLES